MKTPKRILERRRSVRISEPFLFKIGGQGYDIQAISVNLSSCGVMGIVEADIPVMTQLDIGLQLPIKTLKGTVKSKLLRIKGAVVRKERDARTGRFLIAIYFHKIKASDQKWLEFFIGRYLKTP